MFPIFESESEEVDQYDFDAYERAIHWEEYIETAHVDHINNLLFEAGHDERDH